MIMTTKISATITSCLLLTSHAHATVEDHDVQDCSVAADGTETCETVYFDPYPYDYEEEDDDNDDDAADDDDQADDDAAWRADLAGEDCADRYDRCETLADDGECEKNPGFLQYQCAASCGTCLDVDADWDGPPCTDQHVECMGWAAMGECAFNPGFMTEECERSCMLCFEDTNQFGLHQELPHEDDEHYERTKEIIGESIEYMKQIWGWDEEIWNSPTKDNNRINYKCRNMDEDCSFWAVDDCDDDDHAEYMHSNCAPACQTCHTLDTQLRCPIAPGNEPVLPPGGLNALFERIVDDADGSGGYLKYNPRALSRPKRKADGAPAPGGAPDGPWIVVLEDFLDAAEAEALITAGRRAGYARSSDVGPENPDGTHEEDVSDGRTSHNAWCDEDCEGGPVVGRVVARIAAALGTTVDHSEQLQLLQYEPGQYYRQHHDYIEYQQGLPCGVRMLTLFLYLNDVEEGGGTGFPKLDITVQPKKGRALLWPSVLDADPEEKDFRTDHEALPVVKGIKYGANAWIHTRNYREADKNNCA